MEAELDCLPSTIHDLACNLTAWQRSRKSAATSVFTVCTQEQMPAPVIAGSSVPLHACITTRVLGRKANPEVGHRKLIRSSLQPSDGQVASMNVFLQAGCGFRMCAAVLGMDRQMPA